MDEQLFNKARDEALSFNQTIDAQITALRMENLVSEREQQKLKRTALRYIEALDRAIKTPLQERSIQESLILSIIKDYESQINEQIFRMSMRKYSDKRVLSRMDNLIDSFLDRISGRQVGKEAITKVKQDIEGAKRQALRFLKDEVKRKGEKHKPEIVEQTFKSFEERLNFIENKYSRALPSDRREENFEPSSEHNSPPKAGVEVSHNRQNNRTPSPETQEYSVSLSQQAPEVQGDRWNLVQRFRELFHL